MDIQKLDQTYVANTYHRFPLQIVRGKGSVVEDENGKQYIDLGTGIGVNNFGIGDEAWKQAFEESLWENYGVVPNHYEDLGDGVYQVYVEIDGKVVPYVAVDSATGDYHG